MISSRAPSFKHLGAQLTLEGQSPNVSFNVTLGIALVAAFIATDLAIISSVLMLHESLYLTVDFVHVHFFGRLCTR